jgi:AcrR family transcriptional regulator
MTRIANGTQRAYRSDLRAQQAEETRSRILDAAGRVIAAGVASISIPGVAREAGVSIPTVYRHFGTKRDLLAAVYPHLVRQSGLPELIAPRNIEEFGQMVRQLFGRMESFDEMSRAALFSPAADEVRRISMPERIAKSRAFARLVAPGARAADLERIARIFVVLTNSAALRIWRDHLGSSADEAADDIVWILRAAIATAQGTKARS